MTSVAGRSARAEADRRRQRQAQRLQAEREARPVLGRLRQGLFPEADPGKAWDKGARGEEALAAALAPLVGNGTIRALHDRRVPRSRANIDHIVVAASGVWVIDAKRYSGRIAKSTRGGLFTNRTIVTVGGRDRSKLVEGVEKQVDVVASALEGTDLPDMPIRGVLCFVDGDWGLRFRPFSIEDVFVTWPKALAAHLHRPGIVEPAQFDQVVRALATALPPAR